MVAAANKGLRRLPTGCGGVSAFTEAKKGQQWLRPPPRRGLGSLRYGCQGYCRGFVLSGFGTGCGLGYDHVNKYFDSIKNSNAFKV